VLRAWCLNGRIFHRVKCAGFGGLREPPRRIDRDDADELATETVAKALKFFLDEALIGKRWDPSKGATLATFFVGACLRTFGNVYDKWRKENRRLGLVGEVALELELPATEQNHARLEMDEALAHIQVRDQDLLAKLALGHEYSEIASEMKISKKRLAKRLSKARSKAIEAAAARNGEVE
jgi:DNA-directed RNA polymerase specialized sigma24 family protein